MAYSPPHSRLALRTIASKIGWTSVGEPEITRKMSLVAVCCSNDSERSSVRWRSSLRRRVFLMAITALGGEIRKQLDLLVSERSNFLTKDDDDSSWLTVFEHRNCNGAANATELYCRDALRMALGVGARRGEIGDLGGPLSSDCLAHWPARNGAERTAASYFDKCRGYIVRRLFEERHLRRDRAARTWPRTALQHCPARPRTRAPGFRRRRR